jgi:hypothetical protein
MATTDNRIPIQQKTGARHPPPDGILILPHAKKGARGRVPLRLHLYLPFYLIRTILIVSLNAPACSRQKYTPLARSTAFHRTE